MTLQPEDLVSELKKAGRRLRALNEKRYLKSQSTFFGVTVPKTRSLAAPLASAFRKSRDLTGALECACGLWATGVHEPRVAAVMIVGACAEFYDDRVWKLGRAWLGDIDNWALCDGIAPGLLAPCARTAMARYRSRRREVMRWTRDPNPWVRRGALLTTLQSIRNDHESEFVIAVATRLVIDTDYYVQKGLGWMLRECAHYNPRDVISFVQKHRATMRRSTITNAVSRLPKTLQRAARER